MRSRTGLPSTGRRRCASRGTALATAVAPALIPSSLLKKAILAFFNSLRRGAGPRLAPKIKHLRV
jgi:hypothetical protein